MSIRLKGLLAMGAARSICSPDNINALINTVAMVKDVPGDILEIGSYQCGGTIVMAATSETVSPIKEVFAFDTFTCMPEVSEFDEHKAGNFGDIDLDEVFKATSVLPNITLVIGRHEETIPAFTPRPLSFVFMDSDLYVSHQVALARLWPMISIGGIMMFHDWNTIDCPGVQKAFKEYFGETEVKAAHISGMLALQK